MAGQRVHFVGIGGIGMSAIARLLLAEGWSVSGCDLAPGAITQELARQGATIFSGHDPAHLHGVDTVVITAAVRPDNAELRRAQELGLPVLKRAELLGRLMADKRGVAVAGTHGKTTTSSLIAFALVRAGLDPTVLVGGEVPELGGNARRGAGSLLVAEADEFDASFLTLRPEIAVVTNVEAEHLDFYKSFAGVVSAFQQFLAGVPPWGHVVYCLDDPVLAGLQSPQDASANLNHKELFTGEVLLRGALQAQSLVSYGFHPAARWRGERLRPNSLGGTDFLALLDGSPFGHFSLRIPGVHNVGNALAVLATCHLLGVEPPALRDALGAFGGVKRRFQVLGQAGGVTVVDDYAHHPTEVRATLAAARQRFPGRTLRCLFQPHTYSRTRLLMDLYVDAFQDADTLCITEVYAAREDNLWGVSGGDLAQAIRHHQVTFTPTLEEATSHLMGVLRHGDVLLVLGAGDVYRVGYQVLEQLQEASRAV
ncbi:MAG: UDP-N-acetylmuramate--L-alanine ligase [Chloroflexi bacterium]|nr:UDP-N-acetylmuramate--L-alanine ligase [Chloroflexota bacterium]